MDFMRALLSDISRPLRGCFTSQAVRDWQKARDVLGRQKRHAKLKAHLFGLNLEIPDAASALYQIKDHLYLQHCKHDLQSPIVIDVGANIGISCLAWKRYWPFAQIVAIEADQLIAAYLATNLAANDASEVKLIHAAAWTSDGMVSFSSDGADGGQITESGSWVQSIRLRSILQQHERIGFLKIDIEGAENTVLEDCFTEMHRVCNLFVEHHHQPGTTGTLSHLLSQLEKAGFTCHCKESGEIAHPFANPDQDVRTDVFAFRRRK
jgi:FkbM family methyltransferase